ncbi:MAG: hypothetical protein ACLQUY_01320 [Ktedonobacterales bacterium]
MSQPESGDHTDGIHNRQLRHRRVVRWLDGLGAILIVAGIVGVSLSLFGSYRSAADRPGPWADLAEVTSEARAGGLNFVMSVIPGPYVADELLVVNLSLTNYSATTFELQGSSREALAQECGGALYVSISNGPGTQNYFPDSGARCPFMETELKPRDTISFQEFLPLLLGGEVTLQPGAQFLHSEVWPDGEHVTTPGTSPLDGHWPSITIPVSSSTPPDRQITLRQVGTQVEIVAPLLALINLYYNYQIMCSLPQGGSEFDSNAGWEPLSTPILQEPACSEPSTTNLQWTYEVGSPGFAIAEGVEG